MAAFWANFAQFALLFISWLFSEGHPDPSPSLCLRVAPTIEALVTCLDTFTVPHAYYNEITYNVAQPIGQQRADWRLAIQSLLSVEGDCSTTPIPLSLKDLYTVEPFQQHCVLYETASQCGTYLKGWGFMIVHGRRDSVSRDVHVAAPHPGYDLGTVEQAAAVFEATGARSLLVAGRQRTAFLEQTDCVSGARADYYKTDPAHNDQEPFFDANLAIRDWQYLHHDCASSSCGFLQFHGKGASTCPSDDIFLSSGLGNSTASKAWYTDATDRPLKRLQQSLREHFPIWNVSMPSDSNCTLTATKNVVGRHMNGVPLRDVCSKSATTKTATGEFLHVEQASLARQPQHYAAWAGAVRETFEAVCADGMVLDPESQLCTVSPEEDSLDARPAMPAELVDPHRWNGRWYFFMSYLTIFYHI